ncbi:exodeoxyribonuclease VII large subunit, partial [Nocardia tengchongensis]
RHDEVERLRTAAQRAVDHRLSGESTTTRHLREKLAAVGPAATLARGYAVVQRVNGKDREVVRAIEDSPPGTQLRIRVADGAISAAALGSQSLAPRPTRKDS